MKVVLVEDQKLVSSALAMLLNLEADIDVIATADNGEHAKAIVAAQQPDIVVTDIEMPRLDGLSLASWVTEHYPDSKVLVLTTFAKPGYLQSALQAGVHGYLLKDTPADEIAAKLRLIAQGAQVIDPTLTKKAMHYASPLTEREAALLQLIADGLSTKEAADTLCISHGTARNYLSETMQKLHVDNRQAAIKAARQLGLVN